MTKFGRVQDPPSVTVVVELSGHRCQLSHTAGSQELSRGTGNGSGTIVGVGPLAQFNQLLNQSYIDTVRGVAAIIDSHPGTQMIINTNDDLRTLVADVNSSQYRQAEQFVR